MSDGFNIIPGRLQEAQDKLDEAKTIARALGDKVAESINLIRSLSPVANPKKLEPLYVLGQLLETHCHQGLIAQITAFQQAIEMSK